MMGDTVVSCDNFKKCKNCNLYGRDGDAPETVPKGCLYPLDPDLDENGVFIDEPPCERK